MKRLLLSILLFISLVGCCVFVCCVNVNLFDSNQGYYDYFNEEKLIGVDGEINLSGVKSEKKVLYSELLELFQRSDYDYDAYLEEINSKTSGNDDLKKQISNLSNQVSDLEKKKESLNSEYSVLSKKYNSLNKSTKSVVTVNRNNNYNFPLINQYPNYQTGCESVALTMLLKYYGVDVTPDMVIAKLRKGSLPYFENGVLYGGNPEVEFVGNPYYSSGYGAYEVPMAEVAKQFKSGVVAKSNFSFESLINMVQGGKPVMVWTSMGLSLPYISSSWIYKPTGEVVSWKANEHAVVMVGADDSTVTVADLIGGKLKNYSRSTFESRYNYYGKKVLYY